MNSLHLLQKKYKKYKIWVGCVQLWISSKEVFAVGSSCPWSTSSSSFNNSMSFVSLYKTIWFLLFSPCEKCGRCKIPLSALGDLLTCKFPSALFMWQKWWHRHTVQYMYSGRIRPTSIAINHKWRKINPTMEWTAGDHPSRPVFQPNSGFHSHLRAFYYRDYHLSIADSLTLAQFYYILEK